MAKGILNIQAADGAVIGLHVPDGLTSGERQIALGTNLSGVPAYHLLQGNLAVSASTITQGFNTALWTGNGAVQNITTGIDMSTQWGNTVEEKFGGLNWVKNITSLSDHVLFDSVNVNNFIRSNATNANTVATVPTRTSTGLNVTVTDGGWNGNGIHYASWNFQTTHRVTGTTNHGQAYECHYNPFTGFTIVKYTGSGIAGHEIPHMLGRKLGFVTTKNLGAISDWVSQYRESTYVYLNSIIAESATSINITNFGDTACTFGNGANNTASNTYIMYGWANSYFDKANKLIGNYEIGVYQGTGASGNKVPTRGKPAWVMIKRINSIGDWLIYNNMATNKTLDFLYANLSNAEVINNTTYGLSLQSDGFTHVGTGVTNNASGGQYLYIVAYDTNANGGGTYYPLASDTANVQVNNALIPIAQGIDSNGAKNTILSKNETITGLTYTQGKNYLYYDALGNRGVSSHRPRYLESELVRTYAGESPDYFNVKENKWYSTNNGSELVTNGTFTSNTTGWTINGTGAVENNRLKLTSNGTGAYATASITTEIGKTYRFTAMLSTGTTNALLWIGTTSGASDIAVYSTSSNTNNVSFEFVANTTTTYIKLINELGTNGVYAYYDSISCYLKNITPTTEITNGRNYLNHIVYADNDGGVLYVEELPKIEYQDVVKANEFKGKNACTAWVSFDGTTTPPTTRDSHNVSAVVTVSTGVFDIYFKESMDTKLYSKVITGDVSNAIFAASHSTNYPNLLNKCTVHSYNGSLASTNGILDVVIYGGKN